MLREFGDFARRGNVIDLAIGVIMGSAFGKIVSSLVSDVIMPPIGLLLGRVDFSNLYISLSGQRYASLADAQKAGAPTLNYGLFLNNVLNFLLVALAVFYLVRALNRSKRKAPPPAKAPTTRPCPYCLSEIPLKATRCAHCTSELETAS